MNNKIVIAGFAGIGKTYLAKNIAMLKIWKVAFINMIIPV